MRRDRRTWNNNYGRKKPAPVQVSTKTIKITCPHCGRSPRAYLRLVVIRYLECPYCGGTIEPFARRDEARRSVQASLV